MRFILSLFSLILLAACGSKEDAASSAGGDYSSDMPRGEPREEVQQETGNVSYRGIVEPLGISLYMQGTHRLALEDDRFVLLEGPAVDLSAYVGEAVEVFGAVRPTVEAGGVIMRVERVSRTAVRSEEASSDSFQGSAFSFQLSAFSLPVSSSSSVVIPPLSARSSAPSSVQAVPSMEQDEKVAVMAEEEFGASQWTQEYCSTHVGFCIPIHRNWWFKSFGATASSLWHVEVSGEPVENLGDGTLLVNLIQGDITVSGAADREVRMHGNFAVGYRGFSDGRHFEISAPADLKEAVRYMTENLR